jgi:hypothetical protein
LNDVEPIERALGDPGFDAGQPPLDIENLRTHFSTAAGVVRAVDGVSYAVCTGIWHATFQALSFSRKGRRNLIVRFRSYPTVAAWFGERQLRVDLIHQPKSIERRQCRASSAFKLAAANRRMGGGERSLAGTSLDDEVALEAVISSPAFALKGHPAQKTDILL